MKNYISNINLYVSTVQYLKPIQVYYRLYYFFNSFSNIRSKIKWESRVEYRYLNFGFVHHSYSYSGSKNFTFLNKTKKFESEVLWEFGDYGKLWNYNLCYFDYLNNPEVSKEEGIELIQQFSKNALHLKSGMEPYPTSLRIINWIKFLSKHKIKEGFVTDCLHWQATSLTKCLEYHLLGNHLLENAFSIFIAGIFFNNSKWVALAKKIIYKELQEQILLDGGHFELSPMYHQLIVYRTMECLDIGRRNSEIRDEKFLEFLEKKVQEMMGWLTSITFTNGEIPLVNDAANKISPSTEELMQYTNMLGLSPASVVLAESGYRVYKEEGYECFIDVGDIGSKYQPGHAHADTFNYILNVGNTSFIVDTGVSTYEMGERRQIERGTASHNTVTHRMKDSSEVWAGFRVGRRATPIIELENRTCIKAYYETSSMFHRRCFNFHKEEIVIIDETRKNEVSEAHFHFHPSIKLELVKGELIFPNVKMNFEGNITIQSQKYFYANEFNDLKESLKVVVCFKGYLRTSIRVQEVVTY